MGECGGVWDVSDWFDCVCRCVKRGIVVLLLIGHWAGVRGGGRRGKMGGCRGDEGKKEGG